MRFKHKKFWAMLCSFMILFSTVASSAGAVGLSPREKDTVEGDSTRVTANTSNPSATIDNSAEKYNIATVSWAGNKTVTNKARIIFYKYDAANHDTTTYYDSSTQLWNEEKPNVFDGQNSKHYYYYDLEGFSEYLQVYTGAGCGDRTVEVYVLPKDTTTASESTVKTGTKIGRYHEYRSGKGWFSIDLASKSPDLSSYDLGGSAKSQAVSIDPDSESDVLFNVSNLKDQYGYNPFEVKYELIPVNNTTETQMNALTVNEEGKVTATEAATNAQFRVRITITNPYGGATKVEESGVCTVKDKINLCNKGGTPTGKNVTFTKDEEISAIADAAEVDGHTFKYWSTVAPSYNTDNNVTNSSDVAEGRVYPGAIYEGTSNIGNLYPVYEKNTYNVKFNYMASVESGGNTNNYTLINTDSGTVTDNKVDLVYGSTINLSKYKLATDKSGSYDSENFVGWYQKDTDGTFKYVTASDLTITENVEVFGLTTDVEKYVVMPSGADDVENTKSAIVKSNDRTEGDTLKINGTKINELINAAGYQRTGYTMTELTGTGADADVDVNIDLTNGSIATGNVGKEYTLNVKTVNKDGKDYRIAVLTPVWTGVTATITLELQGGSITGLGTIKAIYGDEYGSLNTPTLENYVFKGWFTETNGTGTMILSDSIVEDIGDNYKPSTENATLYAHWEEVDRTATLMVDGEQYGETIGLTKYNDSTYTIPCSLPTPSKEGHEFMGWYYEDTYTTQFQKDDTIPAEKFAADSVNVNLYAKFDANTYYVYLNDNDGSGNKERYSQTYGANYTFVVNGVEYVPSRDGYEFMVWNTNSDGTGTPITKDSVFENTATTHLYAQWEEKMDSPTYQLNNSLRNSYSGDYGIDLSEAGRTGELYDKVIDIAEKYAALDDTTKAKFKESIDNITDDFIWFDDSSNETKEMIDLAMINGVANLAANLSTKLGELNIQVSSGITLEDLPSIFARLEADDLALDSASATEIKELTGKDIVKIWDISLTDVRNNLAFDLEGGSVKVKIPADLIDISKFENAEFVHLENGAVEKFDLKKDGDYYYLSLSSFSPVAVVGTSMDYTSTDDGTSTGSTSTGSTSTGSTSTGSTSTGSTVTTGDSVPMIVILTCLISACAVISFVVLKKRKVN